MVDMFLNPIEVGNLLLIESDTSNTKYAKVVEIHRGHVLIIEGDKPVKIFSGQGNVLPVILISNTFTDITTNIVSHLTTD